MVNVENGHFLRKGELSFVYAGMNIQNWYHAQHLFATSNFINELICSNNTNNSLILKKERSCQLHITITRQISDHALLLREAEIHELHSHAITQPTCLIQSMSFCSNTTWFPLGCLHGTNVAHAPTSVPAPTAWCNQRGALGCSVWSTSQSPHSVLYVIQTLVLLANQA